MKLIGIVLLAVVAATVVAFRFLPWWTVVGGIVLVVVAGYFFSGRIVEALFKIPFRAKGAVLRGASAQIHSVSSTAKYQNDDEDADPNRRYYLLDVTITPVARGGGGFRLWEPGELTLVGPDARSEDTDADGEECDIQKIEIETEGRFADDEGMKFGGPQRLRLTLAVAPDARRLQFRYYFELFGNVSLPA